MPEFLHPPYVAGALVRPRQLNRWLDVNAQNGPLQRSRYYITLPAFSASVEWLGFSDIVAAFNFEGLNNFSISWLNTGNQAEGVTSPIPFNPNYLLAIAWRDSKGNVYRYALWNNVDENLYFPFSLYTGQLIKKNFRLEVWSTNNTPAVQITPIQFYTSVLQGIDYRYSVDATLVLSDAICTSFWVGTTTIPPTNTLPAGMGLLAQFDYNGYTLDFLTKYLKSWTSNVDATKLIPTPGVPIPHQVHVNGLPTFNTTLTSGDRAVNILDSTQSIFGQTFNNNNWGVQNLVLVCNVQSQAAANTALLSAYPSGMALIWNNGTVTVGGGPSVSGLNYNQWYIFVYYLIGGVATLNVYDLVSGNLIVSNTAIAPAVLYSNAVSVGNAGMYVLEALLGSNTLSIGDLNQIVSYMQTKYSTSNLFALPFVWPVGSYPQSN